MKTKRFLALLLTIIMIGVMLPTAFAADTAEPVWDPYFCFAADATSGWTTGAVDMDKVAAYTDLDSTKSTGAWSFVHSFGMEAKSMNTEANDGTTFREKKTELGQNAVILKAKIERSGNYKPSMYFRKYNQLGKLNVYFVPVSYADSKWTMDSGTLPIADVFIDPGVKLVASADAWEDVESKNLERVTEEYSNVYLGAGEYYVIINLDEGKGVSTNANNTYFITTGIKLTRQSGVTVSASKEVIKVGEKATIIAAFTDNRDNPIEADSITYEISPDGIATLDENGTVTGVEEGVATVEVTAFFGEEEYTSSMNITVSNNIEYNFTLGAISNVADGTKNIKVNTITSSAMLDSSASAPWAHSNKTFNINNSWQALYQDYMQFGATETNCGKNALVIKAELDRPAVYRPVLSYWKALHCGKVDVYMIPSAYADSRWAATWTAEEIVNDENLIEIATNVDMSATANATAATAYTGEPVELSEESYYIIYMISEVGKDETLNDRSYGQVDSLVLDYEGELYDEVDNPNIALATTTNVEGYTKIDVQGDIERGTEVTVTAAKIPGYTFRHWVRGTADKGDWVSADPVYNFTLVTNTFLTAVYTPDVAEGEKIVEFFNGNGEYITQETVVDGKVTLPAKNPEMTGFKFLRWIVAKNKEFENNDIIAPLTRVVAEFGDADATFSVNGTEGYKYDTLITKTSDTPVVWYRDGVRVGYGKEYNYRVWDTVGKITSAEGTAQPLVVLDKAVKTDGDGTTKAYMIEYDAGDKEIVEVGILFGDGTNMTVDSCMYKATSQKSGSDIHGQFTAKPANDSYANARGYMIYKDGTEYKVVYSD